MEAERKHERKIKIELFNDHEIWKDIPEYEGIYQASNLGRIKSLDRYVDNRQKGAAQRLSRGRILKSFIAGAGYEYVVLSVKQKKLKISVHRLVAYAFFGVSNLTVHHKNEDKIDNKLSNLEYCTQKENCNKGARNAKLSKIKLENKDSIKRNAYGQFI